MSKSAPSRLPNPIPIVLGIDAGATLLVVLASEWVIGELTRTADERALNAAVYSTWSGLALTYIASALPMLALATLQLWPLYRYSHGGGGIAGLLTARRAALHVPLTHAVLVGTAWLLGLAGFFSGAWINGLQPVMGQVLSWCMGGIARGALCFGIAYYCLEFVMRRAYIPRLFPEGRLVENAQAAPLTIAARFFIFYVAICIFPVVLEYSILRAQLTPEKLADLMPRLELVLLGVLAVSALLTWIVSTAYEHPLVRMKSAVERVRGGDYDVQVAVTSNDEVGTLGDGINDMAAGLKEREVIKETFGRMVDPAVRDHLLAGNVNLGGELRDAAVLFCDIRGFTSLSERLLPAEVVTLLNRHFERAGACIEAERGVVNKYIGDAVMALFGVPVPRDDAAQAAVRAALRMREELRRLNEDLVREGLPALRIGIGIHHGPVLAGNIGSSTRMEYTVIGDTVNLASRVEGLCKELDRDLIVTDSVRRLLDGQIPTEYLAERTVRGRQEVVTLHAIL